MKTRMMRTSLWSAPAGTFRRVTWANGSARDDYAETARLTLKP